MNAYSSPFDRLPLKETQAEPDHAYWKRLRKKWLAELELSGEVSLAWQGREWDKSAILAQIGAWEEMPLAFHQFVRQNKTLDLFLREGAVNKKTFPSLMKMMGEKEDLHPYLGPVVIFQLQQLIRKHVKSGEWSGLEYLFRFWDHLPNDWSTRILQPTEKRWIRKHQELEAQIEAWGNLRGKQRKKEGFPYYDFELLQKELNLYPEDLNALRSRFARTLYNLAVDAQQIFGVAKNNPGSAWASELLLFIRELQLSPDVATQMEENIHRIPWYKSARGRWQMFRAVMIFALYLVLAVFVLVVLTVFLAEMDL